MVALLNPLDFKGLLVGLAELESATSPLSGVRSNQLSYRPISNGTTIVQEIHLDGK